MEIERLETGAVTVLRLTGDIDEEGISTVRMALNQCVEDGHYNLVANLEGVKFISYMGVGVLVERLRTLRAGQGDLRLAGLNLYAQRLLRMAGVTRVFETYSTEAEAIQSFRRAA